MSPQKAGGRGSRDWELRKYLAEVSHRFRAHTVTPLDTGKKWQYIEHESKILCKWFSWLPVYEMARRGCSRCDSPEKQKGPLIYLAEHSPDTVTGHSHSCWTLHPGSTSGQHRGLFHCGWRVKWERLFICWLWYVSSLFFKWNLLASGEAQRAEFAICYLILNPHNHPVK